MFLTDKIARKAFRVGGLFYPIIKYFCKPISVHPNVFGHCATCGIVFQKLFPSNPNIALFITFGYLHIKLMKIIFVELTVDMEL
mgnify:CR=1 FL=1